MQSFILSKDLLDKVSQFSAKASIRPSLAWVYVQIDDNGKITLASTDSYRLHELKWWELEGRFPEYPAFFDTTTEPIKIDSDWVLALIANCKEALVINKNSYVRLWDWFCYVGSAIPSRTEYEEIRLPSTSQLKLAHTVGLNTKFLLEVLKTIPKNESIMLRSKDSLSVFDIEWKDNWDHRHLIMPLK